MWPLGSYGGTANPAPSPTTLRRRTLRPRAATADSQALLLGRLDELAAKQDEIRTMLIELQQPPISS